MEPGGSNHRAIAENPGENDDSQTRAAPGAARSAATPGMGQDWPQDTELRRLVKVWADLPDALRRGIVAMVAAAKIDG